MELNSSKQQLQEVPYAHSGSRVVPQEKRRMISKSKKRGAKKTLEVGWCACTREGLHGGACLCEGSQGRAYTGGRAATREARGAANKGKKDRSALLCMYGVELILELRRH